MNPSRIQTVKELGGIIQNPMRVRRAIHALDHIIEQDWGILPLESHLQLMEDKHNLEDLFAVQMALLITVASISLMWVVS
jgi:hypothetical protein